MILLRQVCRPGLAPHTPGYKVPGIDYYSQMIFDFQFKPLIFRSSKLSGFNLPKAGGGGFDLTKVQS